MDNYKDTAQFQSSTPEEHYGILAWKVAGLSPRFCIAA